MFRMLGAAVAAIFLTWGGAASASTMIYSSSDTNVLGFSTDIWPTNGGGTYTIEVSTSIPILWGFAAYYDLHWDTFIAPAPRPHGEYIAGNSNSTGTTAGPLYGAHLVSQIIIPRTWRYYFTSDGGYNSGSVPIGTPMYYEERPENLFFVVWSESLTKAPFDYGIKISYSSAVPEPATWAMMVVGFSLAGAAVRRRRPATKLANAA